MKRSFAFVVLCVLCLGCFSQSYSVLFKVLGFSEQEIILTKADGDVLLIVDTLTSDSEGLFKQDFSLGDEMGLYKFIFPQLGDAEVPFIFNYEDISLTANVQDISGTIEVLHSQENKVYYDSKEEIAQYKKDMQTLEYVYSEYSGENYRALSATESINRMKTHTGYIEHLKKDFAELFATKIASSSTPVFAPLHLSSKEKFDYLRSHFFDNIDFSDSLLLKTPIISNACIEYLGLYSHSINAKNKSEVLKMAVDSILLKASEYEHSYDFVVNYLLDGFGSMGDNYLVEYISEKFIEEKSCENSDENSTTERKVLSNTLLAVGKDSPHFKGTTLGGEKVDLQKSSNKPIVIVFWASWCSHCVAEIPSIIEHYNLYKEKYDLYTVSLDENLNDLTTFVGYFPNLQSITICDQKSWDGEIAEAFKIYATPSFFVIKDNKIFSKPIDYIELQTSLKQLGIE